MYELWESSGANLIAEFPTQEKALRAVRQELDSRGESDLRTWLLTLEDETGETTYIAEGDALVELARSIPA